MAALAAVPRVFAQSTTAPSTPVSSTGLTLRKLNCFEIRVSDVDASVRFYQGLFGLPVQARTPARVCLRVGDGPQFVAIRQVQDGESPAITHLGYSVEDFDIERALDALTGVGFEQINAPPITAPGIEQPMRTWIRLRGETRELYFADERGLIVQLSATDYCGGSGPAGTECAQPERAPAGQLSLQDLNHFTVFLSGGAEANAFYQDAFGLAVQAYQGPGSPVTGIGDGRQFVMYAGGPARGGAPNPANIHHGSFNMHDFDVDRVLATLTDYGLSDRGDRPIRPLMHYISLRMPERGGAEGGTPELYFTDPDGILLQLQHTSYCGGGGYLGNECLS